MLGVGVQLDVLWLRVKGRNQGCLFVFLLRFQNLGGATNHMGAQEKKQTWCGTRKDCFGLTEFEAS